MQKIIAQPIHFKPYLKSVIWGGKRILTCKSINLDIDNIGESWEISAVPGHISTVDRGLYRGMSLTELVDRFGDSLVGHENYVKHGSEFPLLIKLIDAADNLSIQVHPDDSLAMNRHNSNGKTEMWTIIDCVDDAKVYAGLSQAISPEEYKRRVAENTIMDVVAQ